MEVCLAEENLSICLFLGKRPPADMGLWAQIATYPDDVWWKREEW